MSFYYDLIGSKEMNYFSERAGLKVKTFLPLVDTRTQGYIGLARAEFRAQDFERAQQHWEKVLTLSPANVAAQVGLGNALIRQEKFKQAEAVFQELLEKHPEAPEGYEGLARVASTSQLWEQAIKRWELAFKLFPNNCKYLAGKIQCLSKLGLHSEASAILREGKASFPNEIELDIVQVQLHRAVYDYQAAHTLLKEVSTKEPSNLAIKLELARSYWDLGDSKASKECLEGIQLKISRHSPLFRKFSLLYIDVLLKDNESAALQEFLRSGVDYIDINHKRNFVRICQFLFESENFREVLRICDAVQNNKKITSRDGYTNQILSLFEQRKIAVARERNKLLAENRDSSKDDSNFLNLLDEIHQYMDRNPGFQGIREILIEDLQKVSGIYEKYNDVLLLTSIFPNEAYGVALKIIENIRTKTPFSLVRLGDGEGNFLTYQEKWKQLQEEDQAVIQTRWWGEVKLDKNELIKIQGEYESAIKSSDILGISDPQKICYWPCRSSRLRAGLRDRASRPYRGLIAILDTLLELESALEPTVTLTSFLIHADFETWGIWQLIFTQFKDCSVISCHEQIDKVLYERYGVQVNRVYTIPSEYKYSDMFGYQDQDGEAHYPEGFQRICSDIHVSYPGEVFLVGAGFLGKIYCNIIKQKGGIALDVGSAVDYWSGYETRIRTCSSSLSDYTQYFSEALTKDLHNKASAYLAKSRELIRQGKGEEAMLLYRKAIALEPKQTQKVYQTLGRQFLDLLCFREAEEVFRRSSVQYPEKALGYIGLARVAMSSQRWRVARDRWKDVLNLFPTNISASAGLGQALMVLEDYSQAKEIFQNLIQKHPDKPQGYEGLARLAYKNHNWESFLEWWDTSIAKTGAKSSYTGKARFLVQRTQYEEGLSVIDAQISTHGRDIEAIKTKASLLILAARFEEAITLLHSVSSKNQSSEAVLSIQILLARALIGGKRAEEASRLIESLPSYHLEKSNSNYSEIDKLIRLLKTWRRYYQDGLSLDAPKVFGIGLSRTGTTSLTAALDSLGYVSLHYRNPITNRLIDREDIFYYDAFTDTPISFRFEELYFLFPNAKFIYTERNIEDWVRSISNLFKSHRQVSTPEELKVLLNKPQLGKLDRSITQRSLIYRCYCESLYSNHSSWEDAYRAFENRVTQFFSDKPPEKLLRLNICEGEGWEKLCDFLEAPIPEEPFPYYNKKTARGHRYYPGQSDEEIAV